MRRLRQMLRNEEGATAVIVALMLVPLLGAAAISVDVGGMYAERGQLQNGADAAALAIAQDCAKQLPACATSATVGTSFAGSNALDGTSAASVSFPTSNTVKVDTSTRNPDGSTAVSHPFATAIGLGPNTVGASATAVWGSLESGSVLPLALAYCDFTQAPFNTKILVQYDENKPCKGPTGQPIKGGFGWLDQTPGQCLTYIDLAQGNVGSNPGLDPPSNCTSMFSTLKGSTVYIPIYDCSHSLNNQSCANGTNGQKGVYHIYAFAAFTVTGWKFTGNGNSIMNNPDSTAPSCTGNCRGIQGYFQKWVAPADVPDWQIGGPQLGLSIVRLID